MSYVLAGLLLWFAVGALVATVSIPWAELTFYAKWSGRPKLVAFAFWCIAAALWPCAGRWRRLGFFQGTSGKPMEQIELDDDEIRAQDP